MIAPEHPLPLARQCRLLELARSTFYYKRKPLKELDLKMKSHRRDLPRLALLRQPPHHARAQGPRIRGGKWAFLPSHAARGHPGHLPQAPHHIPDKQHKVYPYLLKGLGIAQANHVWAADICYLPMRRGYAYLVAIMDSASRKTLSFRLSNTLDASFCIEALEEAVSRYGAPEIFNTDQLERINMEVKRRTKTIEALSSEESLVSVLYLILKFENEKHQQRRHQGFSSLASGEKG